MKTMERVRLKHEVEEIAQTGFVAYWGHDPEEGFVLTLRTPAATTTQFKQYGVGRRRVSDTLSHLTEVERRTVVMLVRKSFKIFMETEVENGAREDALKFYHWLFSTESEDGEGEEE